MIVAASTATAANSIARAPPAIFCTLASTRSAQGFAKLPKHAKQASPLYLGVIQNCRNGDAANCGEPSQKLAGINPPAAQARLGNRSHLAEIKQSSPAGAWSTVEFTRHSPARQVAAVRRGVLTGSEEEVWHRHQHVHECCAPRAGSIVTTASVNDTAVGTGASHVMLSSPVSSGHQLCHSTHPCKPTRMEGWQVLSIKQQEPTPTSAAAHQKLQQDACAEAKCKCSQPAWSQNSGQQLCLSLP